MVTTRETNRFDGTLAGAFQFRLVRGEGSYSKVTQRSNLPFNQSEEHQGKFNTRQDIRTMWQTSWAGGALWYQPQISEASIDTFFDSENMDTVSEPGNVFPRSPIESSTTTTTQNTNGIGLQISSDTIYLFEQNQTNQGLIKWPSGLAITEDFTVDSVDPVAMCYSPKENWVVALFADGQVAYVEPGVGGGVIIDDIGTIHYGANIFFHFGRLLVWTGDVLYEIERPFFQPTNAVQTVDMTGSLGGTFTLTFNTPKRSVANYDNQFDSDGNNAIAPGVGSLGGGSETTEDIAYNASAATVKAALEALPSIGSVTVNLDATSKWTITFVNPGSADIPLLEANIAGMANTGPTVVGIGVTTRVTQGGDGPSAKKIYDDGMGPDALSQMSFASSDYVIAEYSGRTAISSNEGIWIAKNVEQEGKPTATLTRVDRNTQGSNIGNPVATMPQGKAVLDLTYHLGSVLMSTTTDIVRVFGNDLSSYGHIPIDIHFFTENTGLGTVGSPLGYLNPSDTIYRFLGAQSDRVFLGGHNNVYVYDAVRGGLHPWLYESGTTPFVSLFFTETVADEVLLYTKAGGILRTTIDNTITANADENHTLESNWFDFNIPSEQKTITHVTLISDGIRSGVTVTLEVQDQEEGGWVTQGSWTSADDNTAKKRVTTASQQTGYRFKYRLTYDMGVASGTPGRVKGVTFHAIEGEMVTQWRLQIDGKEFRSIENQVLRSEDVRSALETYAADQTVITYSDEFRETATTHNVKVEAVQIEGETPEEFVATVVLTEDV